MFKLRWQYSIANVQIEKSLALNLGREESVYEQIRKEKFL